MTQAFPPEMGGNASRIGDTTTYLSDEGWDVTVVAPVPCYPPGQFDRTWKLRSVEEREGVTVHRLWTWQPVVEDPGFVQRAAYYLTFAFHAAAWVLRNGGRFDAILTSTPPIFTGLPGVTGRLVHDLPLIVDVRDLWIDAAASLDEISTAEPLILLSRGLQRLVLGSADRVLTTTPEMRSQLAAKYATVSAQDTTVVPNGVDVSRFASGGGPVEPRIIYTGNLGHAQNLETCIRAMQYVQTGVTLWIVGDGDRRSALEELTAELGLEDAVKFVGLVDRDRVSELLASSSVGVAPIQASDELSYAVPTKAYEYMASGLPVVATGTGAVERLMSESGGGFVVPDDPVTFADTLNELMADDELRRQLGQNGHQYVTDKRSRAAIAKTLSDELQDLLDAPRVTARSRKH